MLDAHSWASHLQALPLDAMEELAGAGLCKDNLVGDAGQVSPVAYLDLTLEQDPESEDGRDGIAAIKVLAQDDFPSCL